MTIDSKYMYIPVLCLTVRKLLHISVKAADGLITIKDRYLTNTNLKYL